MAGLHGAEGSTSLTVHSTWLLAGGLSCSPQGPPPKGCLRWWRASPQASDPRAEGSPRAFQDLEPASGVTCHHFCPSFRNTHLPSTVWERTTQAGYRFCRLAPKPHPSPAHNTQATLLNGTRCISWHCPRQASVFTHAVPSAWKSFPSHLSLAKVYSRFKIQIRTFLSRKFLLILLKDLF